MKMKFLFPAVSVVIITLLIMVACKKPTVEPEPTDVTVTGKIYPTFGTDNLELNQVYTLNTGVKFKISRIKFYFSDVRLGGTQMIDYSLFDFEERGNAWFSKNGEFTVGSALTYGIGVDNTKNHADPSLMPNSSWLSTLNANDMHWSWQQGYVFTMIEGYADTLVDANTNLDMLFSFHVGDNHFFTSGQSQTLNPVLVGERSYEVRLGLDFKEFFENALRPINLATENLAHGAPDQDDLTEKIRLNFAEAFFPYE